MCCVSLYKYFLVWFNQKLYKQITYCYYWCTKQWIPSRIILKSISWMEYQMRHQRFSQSIRLPNRTWKIACTNNNNFFQKKYFFIVHAIIFLLLLLLGLHHGIKRSATSCSLSSGTSVRAENILPHSVHLEWPTSLLYFQMVIFWHAMHHLSVSGGDDFFLTLCVFPFPILNHFLLLHIYV